MFFDTIEEAWGLSRLHRQFPATKAKRSFDVIHCHFGPNGNRALWLRELGVIDGPIMTSFHGYDLNRLPRTQPDMYKDLFREGELFSVGSEFMRRRVVALGAPEERTIIVPCGVNYAAFMPRSESEQASAVADQPFRLLTVARLVAVKGIRYALEAVAIFAKTKGTSLLHHRW